MSAVNVDLEAAEASGSRNNAAPGPQHTTDYQNGQNGVQGCTGKDSVQRRTGPEGHTKSRIVRHRAKKGAGHVYLRASIWWVKYHVAGEPRYESTKSQDREYAEEYLRLRVAHANSRVPMVERMLAQGLDQLRTRAESCQGTIGAVSELMVSIYLMNHGFDVFRSLSPNACCDLIALRYGNMIRIEVKASMIGRRKRTNRYSFSPRAKTITTTRTQSRNPRRPTRTPDTLADAATTTSGQTAGPVIKPSRSPSSTCGRTV